MAQTRRTVAAGADTDAESGFGGAQTVGTGTGSTQGYKLISSLFKHSIITMVLVALFSSTVENAYAYVLIFMFMLVSVTLFLWIKACCKMSRYSTLENAHLPHMSHPCFVL